MDLNTKNILIPAVDFLNKLMLQMRKQFWENLPIE